MERFEEGASLSEDAQSGDIAHAILRLAHSLAGATGEDEMANALVKAVHDSVGSSRSLFYAWDTTTSTLQARATLGYPDDLAAQLLNIVFAPEDFPTLQDVMTSSEPAYYHVDQVTEPLLRERMQQFGAVEAIAVPVSAHGELIGIITASRGPDDAPLQREDEFIEIMRGIAELAATALLKARLEQLEGATVARLMEADRMKSEFLGVVSHELRTPLAAIMGMARTLLARHESLDPEIRLEFVNSIVERGEQLERIVGDLLESSRELELRPAPMDLAHLVRSAVDETRQMARGCTIECETPDRVPLVADGARLRQVLDNLLANAVKFASGGKILVEAARRSDRAWFAVADNGPGMTPEETKHGFEAFFQGTHTNESKRRLGVGLGLYIARRIIDAHGGDIVIDSRVGEGTRVVVEVPTGGPIGATG